MFQLGHIIFQCVRDDLHNFVFFIFFLFFLLSWGLMVRNVNCTKAIAQATDSAC